MKMKLPATVYDPLKSEYNRLTKRLYQLAMQQNKLLQLEGVIRNRLQDLEREISQQRYNRMSLEGKP